MISDLDCSGDPVCSPVPKAKAYNYYNGETARGCIRSSCDLSTGCGSNLRSRIVTSPAIPSLMITVRAPKREPSGPPAAFTCAKSAVTLEIAIGRRECRRKIRCDYKVTGLIRNSAGTLIFSGMIGCNWSKIRTAGCLISRQQVLAKEDCAETSGTSYPRYRCFKDAHVLNHWTHTYVRHSPVDSTCLGDWVSRLVKGHMANGPLERVTVLEANRRAVYASHSFNKCSL